MLWFCRRRRGRFGCHDLFCFVKVAKVIISSAFSELVKVVAEVIVVIRIVSCLFVVRLWFWLGCIVSL